ncbi:MAG: hypothetical protein ACD_39C00603G0002 [uncultured bacterium]|nr:MAG: hypothetical protein ACD_39C00603G0002 [uncultured bacterium]
MIKKSVLAVLALALAVSASYAVTNDFKVINGLKYNQTMFKAVPPQTYLQISLGRAEQQVGGVENDVKATALAVPSAFRPSEGGKVWVLDSGNLSLKLFISDGKLEKLIRIDDMGKDVIDFAVASDGSFAFLNAEEGYVIFADSEGRRVNEIEGLNRARSIEFSRKGDLLVDFPVMNAVLRFSTDGELIEQNVCDASLSLFESVQGLLYGLDIFDRTAKVYVRTSASPAEVRILAELPCVEIREDVAYGGGKIIGTDAAGNVYFWLMACDEAGCIYRERLYRASPEGKITGELDILSMPDVSRELPRKLMVSPDGKVIGFHVEGKDYILSAWTIPDKAP